MVPTDAQIKEAAESLAAGVGEGGFRVYRPDLTGGAWYSDGSRPHICSDEVVLRAPRAGVKGSRRAMSEAEDTIRRAVSPHTECSYCEGTGLGPDGAECELCEGYGYTVPARER